jgi:hypothetical protein
MIVLLWRVCDFEISYNASTNSSFSALVKLLRRDIGRRIDQTGFGSVDAR